MIMCFLCYLWNNFLPKFYLKMNNLIILFESSWTQCIQNLKDHLFNLIVPVDLKVRND